jgi:hypothetical protein
MGVLQTILSIPYLVNSLGSVCAIAVIASPIMYNGDYKKPVRAVFVLSCCTFFTWFILYCCDDVKTGSWLLPTVIAILTNLSFVLGLYIGIFIHNLVKRKQCKI